MCGRPSSNVFDGICEKLRRGASLLVVTHGRPDGDGLGSMAALAGAAQEAGKAARMFLPDKVPARYEFLFPAQPPATAEEFSLLAGQADVIVILDTCAFSQLDELEGALRAVRAKIVVIDHHATTDDVGDLQWVDTSAAATGVMVCELLEALGWPVNPAAAEALVVAITSDTGWLRFANTDARCLRATADLLARGVRTDRLYKRIYQNDRPQRLQLVARVLDSLELHCNDRLAVMTIRKADFDQTGTLPEETENLVNEALRVGSVETAVLLVENSDGVRVSMRSRDAVNVAEIARCFGGGGHARAAGLRADEDIGSLKAKLIEACSKALEKA